MGHFYLDLFSRPHKNNHAYVIMLIQRSNLNGNYVPPASMLNTGFVKKKGEPTLLFFNQVITFFHEFGHLMHNICSKANFSVFSGTNVEADFVEMPSQLMENWVY